MSSQKEYCDTGSFYSQVQDHESGIERKDVFVCRTSGVHREDYEAIKLGINRIIEETRRNLQLVDHGNFNLGNHDFGSADWYQESSMTNKDTGLGRQVCALKLDQLLRQEPYQLGHPHYDLMVIDRDLTISHDAGLNFLFGYGPYPNNIVSTKRFRKFYPNRQTRKRSLAVLTAHEFGHNLGLLGRNFNMGIEGLRVGHCNGEQGPCLMEQINVHGCRDINEQADILFNRQKWLCADCSHHVQIIKNRLRRLGIRW